MNKYEETRQSKIAYHKNNIIDDGRMGRAHELECSRVLSRKTSIAEQNEIDNYIKIIGIDSKYRYVPCECKINGGRIDELLNGSKAKYVIYKLDVIQKHKATQKHNEYNEIRQVSSKVIPVALFLSKLQEFNAIKTINKKGKFDGYGIQCSSKKWYEWLKNYPINFDRETTFKEWEFVGLF